MAGNGTCRAEVAAPNKKSDSKSDLLTLNSSFVEFLNLRRLAFLEDTVKNIMDYCHRLSHIYAVFLEHRGEQTNRGHGSSSREST